MTIPNQCAVCTRVASGIQFVREERWDYDPQKQNGLTTTMSGAITLDDFGKVSTGLPPGGPFTMTGEGGASAALTNGLDSLALRLDLDADGTYELGRHFLDEFGFRDHDFDEAQVLPVEEMNHPPVPGEPFFSGVTAGQPVEVYYEVRDPDTPESELAITNHWAVNGVAMEDVTGTTLPAEKVKSGDTVTFYYTVSHGRWSFETREIMEFAF